VNVWVLVIYAYAGAYGAPALTTVPGFKDRAACISAIYFVRKRPEVRDAFCVAVK